MRTQRITVSADPDAVDAGRKAVAEGHYRSMSEWVNAAMIDKAARDARLDAARAAVAEYEAEYGVITDEEMEIQRRKDRETAIVIRGGKIVSGLTQ